MPVLDLRSPQWKITVLMDGDQVINETTMVGTLANAIRRSVGLAKEPKIGNVEACIYKAGGAMVGWVHLNFRGDVDAVSIFSPVSSIVTDMNPHCKLISEVL